MVYIIGTETTPIDNILNAIKEDMHTFRGNGDFLGLNKCQLILGEIQRDPNKDYSNENVTEILKRLRKITLNSPEKDTLLVELIDTYIPPPVSDIEALAWLKDNYSTDEMNLALIGECKKFFGNRDVNAQPLREYIEKCIPTVKK